MRDEPQDDAPRILILGGLGETTWIITNALLRDSANIRLIVEDRIARSRLLRRRANTLGPVAAIGQAMFVAFVVPALRRTSRQRIDEIMTAHGLSNARPDVGTVRVPSVNSEAARREIARTKADVIVISGTRIIGRRTLALLDVPTLNLHMGITPLYRGVHGGYWALREGRVDLVGSTIHLVDAGIDTGKVVSQTTFRVGPHDNFVTYPYLHLATGIPALRTAVRQAFVGSLRPEYNPRNLPSRLRTHPTLWSYLKGRLTRGVR